MANELVNSLSRHDLLVQLIRAREAHLVINGMLDADNLATLIEEVLGLADHR